MKREILTLRRHCGKCCVVHDKFPAGRNKSRQSHRARSKGIRIEHRWVRRKIRHLLHSAID